MRIRVAGRATRRSGGRQHPGDRGGGKVVRMRSGELRRLVSDDTERKAVDAIEAEASHWVDYTKEYLSLADKNRFDDAHAVLVDKMLPSVEDAENAGKLLAQTEREALSASDKRAKSDITGGRWAVWIVIVLNLLVTVAMLWLVFRITSTLRQVTVEVGSGTEEVRGAASQLSSSSQSLAQGCSEQAARSKRLQPRAKRSTPWPSRTARIWHRRPAW